MTLNHFVIIMADQNTENPTVEKPTSTTKPHDVNDDQSSRHRKRRDRSRSSSDKRHRHKRSRSRSRSRHRRHHHHHHRQKRYRHSRSRSPRRKRSRSSSRSRRRPSPAPIPTAHTAPRITEEDKKRTQVAALQALKDMAANETLDLSRLTIDDLRKAIDVPKEKRTNQTLLITFQMDEIRKLIEELTGIAVPKIYNTGAVNPLQYAQQQRKRKLLWSKTNDKTSTSKVGAAITDGQDEKTAEKFRKLLGMKAGGDTINDATESNAIHQQQQDTFDSLDKEYQTARITTHLRRGVGLGFLSQGPFVPSPSADKN